MYSIMYSIQHIVCINYVALLQQYIMTYYRCIGVVLPSTSREQYWCERSKDSFNSVAMAITTNAKYPKPWKTLPRICKCLVIINRKKQVKVTKI